MKYVKKHLEETKKIIHSLDNQAIENMVIILKSIKERKGRLFILGVGGSASNASHAVNDFRKICNIEAYSPADNVSELTARTNDEGWDTVFSEWLKGSSLKQNDCIFVLSVGGGNKEKNVSVNLIKALELATIVGCPIIGIVGRDGGFTAEIADACVIIPPLDKDQITPHTEGFQALIWHLLVSHPKLQKFEMKWESVEDK